MVAGSLRNIMASAAVVGAAVLPMAGNAQDASVQKVAASDVNNVNFAHPDRNFVISYNPNVNGFNQFLLEDTLSDITSEGCKVDAEPRRYGSFYTLKAPWFEGHNVFRVDDLGTVGGMAIDLCRNGDLDSGPA